MAQDFKPLGSYKARQREAQAAASPASKPAAKPASKPATTAAKAAPQAAAKPKPLPSASAMNANLSDMTRRINAITGEKQAPARVDAPKKRR